jgi:hypothetical protein
MERVAELVATLYGDDAHIACDYNGHEYFLWVQPHGKSVRTTRKKSYHSGSSLNMAAAKLEQTLNDILNRRMKRYQGYLTKRGQLRAAN